MNLSISTRENNIDPSPIRRIEQVGIWAWDCVEKEYILVLIWILAFLGDNPMQSEFACHIGLRGRMFCRVCKVEGKRRNAQAQQESPSGGDIDEAPIGGDSDAGDASDAGSDTSTATTRKRRQPQELLSDMVRRITNFIHVLFHSVELCSLGDNCLDW